MRNIIKYLTFLTVLFITTNVLAGNNSIQQQRKKFYALYQELTTNKPSATSKSLSTRIKKFKNYPLYRYLVYEHLYRNFYTLDSKEINKFLIDYADSHLANKLANSYYYYLAKKRDWQTIIYFTNSTKFKPNNCTITLTNINSSNMKITAESLSQLWLNNQSSNTICAEVFNHWFQEKKISQNLIEKKAVVLSKANNDQEFDYLIKNTNSIYLTNWLTEVKKLINNPDTLPNFIQHQKPTDNNKKIILNVFSRYIKSFTEDAINPQQVSKDINLWATKLGLSNAQINNWYYLLVSRMFDQNDLTATNWRDQQISRLKIDNLTERRIRKAITEQTDYNKWLQLLSAETKLKDEWVYWYAKYLEKQQKTTLSQQLFTKIEHHINLYALMASQKLKHQYTPKQSKITEKQYKSITKHLKSRAIQRVIELVSFDNPELNLHAKREWNNILANKTREEKISFAEYAKRNNWADLQITATIAAKAWPYIDLRFPIKYKKTYKNFIKQKSISPSFAYAITRQESAWSTFVTSPKDARGLMQLLPETAKTTAKRNKIKYKDSQQLYDAKTNIALGVSYLNERYEKFDKNRIFAAIAYNAGDSRVVTWLARSNGKLQLDEFIATIPFKETRGYVEFVIFYDYLYQRQQKNKQLYIFTPQEINRNY